MKKFLSIFVALAMVLSLFAGVGARSAKADTSTLTLTPAGSFVGGVDGSGTLGINALGNVATIGDGTYAMVNVTTAGAGSFDKDNGIEVLHAIVPAAATIDKDWALPGYQWITVTAGDLAAFAVGSTIVVGASSTNGVGKIVSMNNIPSASTLAYVNVTTAAVGYFTNKIYTVNYADSTVASSLSSWQTVTAAGAPVSIPILNSSLLYGGSLANGDLLTAYMLQAVPATPATAFVIVSGTPLVGDIATVTWQDTTAASHTVSYTTVAGDGSIQVATALTQLITALDVTTGNVSAKNGGTALITLTQDVAGVAGNGKTVTATTTAAVTPTLTIHTLGGLTQPGYVENGKTIKLVAVDATGATVSVTWSNALGAVATVDANGLVLGNLTLTGVSVITAKSGTATGVFAVVVVPVQIITSMAVNLVPALPVSTTLQQFGAIASNAAYSQLDYTTQAVWTDALPVASISTVAPTQGLLTYSTDETGAVNAYAGGITTMVNVKVATGVVTLVTVVGPVTKVIVLTIGSDIVTVDAKATTVDAAPEIVDGRTFVPIRFIAETFGSTVTWLPETKGITITLGTTTIGLQIGNATAVINGTIIALDAAPYIKNSRTMVPLRVITESFGGNVAWDPINHIITITYVLPVA
jgi:hypothetical protein